MGEVKQNLGELSKATQQVFDVGKDIQNYLARIGGKTASLFAVATEGGASLGNSPESVIEAMRVYGWSLGMAFQIVDDILDYTGDEALMGKPVGSDLREGTITLPGLLLLERYPVDNPIKKFFTAKRSREERLQEAIAMVRSRLVTMKRQASIIERVTAVTASGLRSAICRRTTRTSCG